MRKKEWYMDYATHAFVCYAQLGRPTREEYERRLRSGIYERLALEQPDFIVRKANDEVRKHEALLDDIAAVDRVLHRLEEAGRTNVIDALNAVYFTCPFGKPCRGDITGRVTRFALEYPCTERAVYMWLKSARIAFCKERGLNVGYAGERW